jgi:hypothetical protein
MTTNPSKGPFFAVTLLMMSSGPVEHLLTVTSKAGDCKRLSELDPKEWVRGS